MENSKLYKNMSIELSEDGEAEGVVKVEETKLNFIHS